MGTLLNIVNTMWHTTQTAFSSVYNQVSGGAATVATLAQEQAQNVAQFASNAWNTAYGDVSAIANLRSANVILHVQTMDSSTQSMINNGAQGVIDGLNVLMATSGTGWQIQKWGNYQVATGSNEIRFNMTESGSWPILLTIALVVAGLAILYVIAVDVYDAATGQPLFGSSAATISPALQSAIQNLSPDQKAQVLNQALKTQAVQATTGNPISAIGATANSLLWLALIGIVAYFLVESGLLKTGAEKVKAQTA